MTLAATSTLHVAAGALAAEPGPAASESNPSVGLAWTGPGPELVCLGEAGLARAVNEYLGRDAFASGPLEYVLGVNVERLPDRLWRAVLELRDGAGHVLGARELRSTTDLCSDLDEPLVLAVALMVDSQPEPPPAPPPAPPAPEPEPEPEPSEQPEPADSHTSAESLDFFANASLALEAGLLPAVRPGLMLGAELRAVSWLSARLSGVAFLPVSVDVTGGGSAQFVLVAGVLELCPSLGDKASFRLSFCGGAVYGALGAKSTGLAGSRSTWERVFGGAFGLGASLPLSGRWFGSAGLTGIVPYRPARFVYELGGVSQELFQMSSFSALASVGASVMF